MTYIVLSATLIQDLVKTECLLPASTLSQREVTTITYLKTGGQERMAFSITGCAYGNNANNSSLTLNTEVNFTGLEDLLYVKI